MTKARAIRLALILLLLALLGVPLTLFGLRKARAWFNPVLLEQALSNKLSRLLGLEARVSRMRLYSILGPEFEAALELRDPGSARTILTIEAMRLALRPLEGLRKRSARVEILVPDAQMDLTQEAGQPPLWPIVLAKVQTQGTMSSPKQEPGGAFGDAWRLEVAKMRFLDLSIMLAQQSKLKETAGHAPLQARELVIDFSSAPESYLFSAQLPGLDAQAGGTWTPAAERLEWSLNSGQDRVKIKGTVTAPHSRPQVQLHLLLRAWEGAIPPGGAEAALPAILGVFGGDLKASWESFHPDYSKATLEGAGRLEADAGLLARLNIPAGIFESLERIAAFRFLLQNKRLKKDLYDFLHARQTPFQSLQSRFEVAHGRLSLVNFRMRHPFYNLEASGGFGLLDRTIDLTGNLIFTDELSNALIREFPDFEALTNRKGRIELPFFCRGRWPQASPEANLNQVAARLLKARGDELRERGMTDLSELMEYHL